MNSGRRLDVKCMITQNTVFVLGAGTGVDYGLPTGPKLREKIIDLLSDKGQLTDIVNQCGVHPALILEFLNSFEASELPSIDSFLEKQQSAEFIRLGKVIITYIIGMHESPADLKKGWLTALWHNLIPGTKIQSDILKNKIKFITFNYDRTLEAFLEKVVYSSFPKRDIHGFHELLNSFQIIHPYGQAGLLEWQANNSNAMPVRPYKNEVMNWPWAVKCSVGIKVMHEENSKSPEFELAREWLAEAEKIVFLGFGYHFDNMSRLAFSSFELPEKKKIIGHYHNDAVRIPAKYSDVNANGLNAKVQIEQARSIAEYVTQYADLR